MTTLENLIDNLGKVITIKGEITGIMWQHCLTSFEGYPYINYIDLDDNYIPQIIINSKELIDFKGMIEVTGKIFRTSHEITYENVKIKETIWEYNLLVDYWNRL